MHRYLAATLTAAAFNALALARDCNRYNINATASAIFTDQNTLSDGTIVSNGTTPATWNWTMLTQSRQQSANETDYRQEIGVTVDPPLNLSSVDLQFRGCGLLVQGLKDSVLKKALGLASQNKGSCDNILSSECQAELSSGPMSTLR